MHPWRPVCSVPLPRPRRGAYKARVHPLAWALAGTLTLAPATSSGASPATPSAGTVDVGTAAEPPDAAAEPPGRLVFGPDHRGTLTLVDAGDREVAVVSLRPGRRTIVELPPGRYTLRDAAGTPVETIELRSDEARGVELPPTLTVAPSGRPAPSVRTAPERAPAVTTGRLGVAPPAAEEAEQEVELVRRRPWARWAAPLLSAIVPGAGQALNRQPGRGLAVFTGTVGLVLGTVATWAARDPNEGAMGDGPGRDGREVARLIGFAGLSTAAGLLYLGQILDAHAKAVGRRAPRPARDHVVALEVSRSTTVGFAAGRPPYDLYSDWSLAIMGQVAPRVTLGLSDASIKYARHRDMVTVQAGVRAAYRFFDRRRVWLAAGGGALLQGTRADRALEPLVPDLDAPRPDAERAFSVVPYVHFDARLFLLDRWSLGLVPRVSLPLAARRYGGGRALPRYATTFELGAVLGVYF